ncbi:MAG: holo-ACP synthase [Anaerolineae bacterium]|nr:holo-ACP synthase [Anaerolineae bacterium]
MILKTGIDLVEIERIAAINPAIRRRFIERIFTPAEQLELGDSNERLAGGFALKEAVSKALGCGIGPIRWHEINIHHNSAGAPQLILSGQAAILAAQQGLDTWSVSISHSRTHAVALAVAAGMGDGLNNADLPAENDQVL